MVLAPTVRADAATASVTLPFVRLALPSGFDPDVKTIAPVGCVPPLAGRTVAVRFVEAFC
jgi:hypothetical protein